VQPHERIEDEQARLEIGDPTEKLEALNAMTPPTLRPGRFRTPDKLLAMLGTAGRKPNYAE
jgi:hypothetical protein